MNKSKKKELSYITLDARGKSERTIANDIYKKYRKKYGLTMETTEVFEVLDANRNVIASVCLIIIFSYNKKGLDKVYNKIDKRIRTAHEVEQSFVNFLYETTP